MMIIRYVCIMVVVALLSGCATDPLTGVLRNNNFCPIIPIPEKQDVGDIYRNYSLSSMPVLFMNDVFTKEENARLKEDLKKAIQLPSISWEKTFSLSATSDVIGYAQGSLKTLHVRKFKLKLGDVSQYILSEDQLSNIIFPRIVNKRPNLDLKGKYIVLALLGVSRLEYELLDENGNKIEVAPGGEIEKVVKANLSLEWKTNEQLNLVIDRPCFLGYRIGKIIEDKQGLYTVKNVHVSFPPPKNTLNVKEVPVNELRKLLRSSRDNSEDIQCDERSVTKDEED